MLNATYWENRYQEDNTPWDVGAITTPMKTYIDQLEDKSLKILIPGCGGGHEAIYLYEAGFHNVFVCDWSESALGVISESLPIFPKEQLRCADFFELEGQYDLILEQTFFCAIEPRLRPDYAKQCSQLLRSDGKLAGLLFGIEFPFDGPPFGGSQEEYKTYFEPFFEIEIMETAYNSIAPRMGNELFVKMVKIDEN